MKKVYIAGKVSGLKPSVVESKFQQDETFITKNGFEAVNPVKIVNNSSCDWKTAMKKCIAELINCDAVYVQIDWKSSKGAQIEVELAITLGIPVYESLWLLKSQLVK